MYIHRNHIVLVKFGEKPLYTCQPIFLCGCSPRCAGFPSTTCNRRRTGVKLCGDLGLRTRIGCFVFHRNTSHRHFSNANNVVSFRPTLPDESLQQCVAGFNKNLRTDLKITESNKCKTKVGDTASNLQCRQYHRAWPRQPNTTQHCLFVFHLNTFSPLTPPVHSLSPGQPTIKRKTVCL